MHVDNTLAGVSAGLAQLPPAPPNSMAPFAQQTNAPEVPGGNGALYLMVTQVWQQGVQLATQMAVMQANVGNIDRRTANMEHDLGARVKELESARLTEARNDGSLRADLATQVAQAIIAARDVESRQNQQRSSNTAQWGSQLSSAMIAGAITVLGIIMMLVLAYIQKP